MFKKLAILTLTLLIFVGCSLIPRVNFNTPNTVPQQTEKSKKTMKCKGEIHLDDYGRVVSCSDGFYSNENLYNKAERRMTITERVKSLINGLVGFGFWGFVLIAVLCPSLIGLIIGRITEGAVGVGASTLRAVSRAVQRTRKTDVDLNTALESELDEKHKNYIKTLKRKEKIK